MSGGGRGGIPTSPTMTEQSPSAEFVHPETGELLATEGEWRAALAAVERQLAPIFRTRRQIREAYAERFPPKLPERRRDRTETQEKVAHCPRCGAWLDPESEEPPQARAPNA